MEGAASSLSVRDSRAFVEGLLNPPPSTIVLRETIRLYREETGI